VKKGQKDRYLKNEQELAEHLLTAGLEGVQVLSASGTPVATSQIIPALKAAARFSKAVDRVARKIHPDVMRGLVYAGVNGKMLEDKDKLDRVLGQIAAD